MNTKRVLKELNITQKALRIYEDLGIILPKRDDNNYRNYSDEDLIKIKQIILLKEMGISLKDIKVLLDKNKDKENKVIKTLDLQLKAVENKINELNNIKSTLEDGINEILASNETINYGYYFKKIDECLKENKEKRSTWIDKWAFDSWAKDYDTSIKSNIGDELNLFEKYDFILDTISEIINKNKDSKVIDMGCGTCNLYTRLNEDISYIGIDQSLEMLMEAKRKYKDINLRLGNFLDNPYIENDKDFIVSTYAFHHLTSEEKKESIKLMLKYLKINGKIIIADLMFLNSKEREKEKEVLIKAGRKDLWDIIEDEFYADIEELKSFVESIGYKFNYKHLVNFTWIIEINKNK